MPKLKDLYKLPEFVRSHKLAYLGRSSNPDYDGDTVTTEDVNLAQVVLSTVDDGKEEPSGFWHRPVLDLDFPAALVPSTTEGHFHLYLDKKLSWDQYLALLTVLSEVGLIEPGYLSASKARKCTSVRLPWVKKGLDD